MRFIYHKNPIFYSSTVIRYGDEDKVGKMPSAENVKFEADEMVANGASVLLFTECKAVAQFLLQPGEWVVREDSLVMEGSDRVVANKIGE